MEKSDITIGIVGSGGDGVVAAGSIIIDSASRVGLHCIMVKSFGPQIRGGESSCRLRISTGKIHTQGDGVDILVCFNWIDYHKFARELEVEEDVIVLMDEDDETPDEKIPLRGGRRRRIVRIPFNKIAKESGNAKGKNMATLGVLAELFNLPREDFKIAIRKKFKKKKSEVIKANIKAMEAGEKYVREHVEDLGIRFKYKKHKPRMMLTGNEAVAFGAMAAGCKFFSSYPITPASEIMEWLSHELPKQEGIVVQAEDEISAVCMVTGAAYGGIKAMTATSGPGLSLKSEAIGLGTMAELPYVVIDVQRGGPSTGMPTKFEQGDLCQAICGMHGDAPHAVIAASDVEDCFRVTMEAFNVAESYQMPVIVLTDQFLGHRMETVRELDFEKVKLTKKLKPRRLSKGVFKRFADTPDGISPMTWPGVKNGEYLCSGIEHDEWGAPTSKFDIHEKMSAKRHKKLNKLSQEYEYIRRFGERVPKVGVIGWGSNKGVIREAVDFFVSKGHSVGGLVPQLLYPLQKHLIQEFCDKLEALVVVEHAFGGDFKYYLRSRVDLPKAVFHLKSAGGRYFTSREVIQEIDKAMNESGIDDSFRP